MADDWIHLSDVPSIADQTWAERNGQEPEPISAIDFTPIRAFADVDEPSAEPLATDHDGGAAIPANAFILLYGDGGAGKTTLTIDLACHLATGKPWLDLITPTRPLRIALIENEGPRAMFRKKLRRKLEHGWELNDDQIVILTEPWQAVDLRNAHQRNELVTLMSQHQTDLLVAGPLSRLGMRGGGTLDEIGAFSAYLTDIQQHMDNPLSILLIHHENRAGRISGAWEGIPDTLVHVQAQGHGHTRVFWQKLRWGSYLHGKSTHLAWAEGESFTVEENPTLDDNSLTDMVTRIIHEHPGCSWGTLVDQAKGARLERIRSVRNRLLDAGIIINEGTERAFQLYLASEHPENPRIPQSDAGFLTGFSDIPQSDSGGGKSGIPESQLYKDSGIRIPPPPDDDIPF